MREDVKKILVITAVAVVLFWLGRPKKDNKKKLAAARSSDTRNFIKKPMLSDDDLQYQHLKLSYDALCAYIDAYNTNASDTALEEIKNGFRQEIYIDIYTDDNGKLAVRDLEGNDILVNS